MKNLHRFSILIFVSLFISIPSPTKACSCQFFETNFCESIDTSDNIFIAVVTDSIDFSMREAVVIKNLYKATTRDTINIFGHDGLNCGEFMGFFNIGDTLVFAVEETVFLNEYIYYLSSCGLFYLHYQDEMVTGQITDQLTTQSIDEFIDNLPDCMDLVLPVEEVDVDLKPLQFYPNPVVDELTIINSDNDIEQLDIYSISGKSVYANHSVVEEKVTISFDDLGAGVYIVKVRTGKGVISKKIIKN